MEQSNYHSSSYAGTTGEVELYKVLQRANLLGYYDTFIMHGGDDVQQLCDADEEEFLEIMSLIGMASKPLHVRRLQKALQEWATNPRTFQSKLKRLNQADEVSMEKKEEHISTHTPVEASDDDKNSQILPYENIS